MSIDLSASPNAEQLLRVGAIVSRCPAGAWLGPSQGSPSTLLLVDGQVRGHPVFLPPGTYDRIQAEVTTVGTAGSLVRLGLYADDGTGKPGNLVVDAGTIDGTSATAQEKTIAITIPGGIYWTVGVAQGTPATAATVRSVNVPALGFLGSNNSLTVLASGYFGAAMAGALPASYVPTTQTNVGAFVEIRKA